VFGSCALFGILAWVLGHKRAALLLPVLGVVMGYGAFVVDHRVAVVTLYEVMVEGSLGLAPGTPAPVRSFIFNVEHPAVEHDLLVAPVSKTFEPPKFSVEVSFSLHGPAGEPVVAERTERFRVVSRPKSKTDWEGKTFHFTPLAAGLHTLRVMPLTTDIPHIHVRVADPLKRDGKRAAGY
jgi:hypothetical protein